MRQGCTRVVGSLLARFVAAIHFTRVRPPPDDTMPRTPAVLAKLLRLLMKSNRSVLSAQRADGPSLSFTYLPARGPFKSLADRASAPATHVPRHHLDELLAATYYVDQCSREAAETRLSTCSVGTYLVRLSSARTSLVLSVMLDKAAYRHIRILWTEAQGFHLCPSDAFESVDALLQFYHRFGPHASVLAV